MSNIDEIIDDADIIIESSCHGSLEAPLDYINLNKHQKKDITQNLGLFTVPENMTIIMKGMFGSSSYKIPNLLDTTLYKDKEELIDLLNEQNKYPEIYGCTYIYNSDSPCLNLTQQRDTEREEEGDKSYKLTSRDYTGQSGKRTARDNITIGDIFESIIKTSTYTPISRLASSAAMSARLRGGPEAAKKKVQGGEDSDFFLYLSEICEYYIKNIHPTKKIVFIISSCQVVSPRWFCCYDEENPELKVRKDDETHRDYKCGYGNKRGVTIRSPNEDISPGDIGVANYDSYFNYTINSLNMRYVCPPPDIYMYIIPFIEIFLRQEQACFYGTGKTNINTAIARIKKVEGKKKLNREELITILIKKHKEDMKVRKKDTNIKYSAGRGSANLSHLNSILLFYDIESPDQSDWTGRDGYISFPPIVFDAYNRFEQNINKLKDYARTLQESTQSQKKNKSQKKKKSTKEQSTMWSYVVPAVAALGVSAYVASSFLSPKSPERTKSVKLSKKRRRKHTKKYRKKKKSKTKKRKLKKTKKTKRKM